jgi:hypothetical protein
VGIEVGPFDYCSYVLGRLRWPQRTFCIRSEYLRKKSYWTHPAVEGGGIRVGGGMCDANFNGGNCMAVHVLVYAPDGYSYEVRNTGTCSGGG